MTKRATFGNAVLAGKLTARFGTKKEGKNVEMQHVSQVREFIRKAEEVHQKAANSKLVFG